MRIIILIIFFAAINIGLCQNTSKDSLFLIDKSDNFRIHKNPYNIHYFWFEKIDFVSSAFGNRIIPMDMSYFVEASKSKGKRLSIQPAQVYDIEEYLNANRKLLIDEESNKYDCY